MSRYAELSHKNEKKITPKLPSNPCETTSNKTRVSPKHKARVNANMRLVTFNLFTRQYK